MKRLKIIVFIIILLFISIKIFVLANLGDSGSQIIDSIGNVGIDSSIAMDSRGYLHILHFDNTNTYTRYCQNSAGYWSCKTGLVTSGYTSVAVDSTDKLHFAIHDSLQNDLYYCTDVVGSSFICYNLVSSGIVGQYPSIAIDSNDNVHISYYDSTNQTLGYCYNNQGGYAGYWNCSELDNGGLDIGAYSSIAIDSNNYVHVASKFTSLGGAIKYCNSSNYGISWSCESIDYSFPDSRGLYTSISIDSSDKIHISEYDSSAGDLRYCNGTAGSWDCQLLDSTGDVGLYSSIAIDPDDNVHISYYDGTNRKLKYCTDYSGSFACINISTLNATGNNMINYGRGLVVKKGRIVDSVLFSDTVHGSIYNNTDLVYWNYSFRNPDYHNFSVETLTSNESVFNSYSFNISFLVYGDTQNYSCSSFINSSKNVYNYSTLNNTQTNLTPTSLAEGNHTYYIECESGSSVNKSTNQTLIISINPNLTINSPLNQTYNVNTTIFNITASDDSNISNCLMNLDGYSNITLSNSSLNNYNYTNSSMTEGSHNVTFYCNDTYNNLNTSSVNFLIDTIYPNTTINSVNSTINSQTFTFNSTASDDNLNSCFYSIYNSTGGIDGSNSNISFTCNTITSPTATSYGMFTLRIYAVDLAGNENYSEYNFTLSSSPGEGGGGGTTIIGNATFKMTTQDGAKAYVFSMIEGTSRNRDLFFENLGSESKTLTLACEFESGERDLCNYLFLETTEFTLPLQKDIITTLNFNLDLPSNISRGEYKLNIIATNNAQSEDKDSITITIIVPSNFISIILAKIQSFKYIGIFLFTFIISLILLNGFVFKEKRGIPILLSVVIGLGFILVL